MKKTYVILVEDYPAAQHYIYDNIKFDSEEEAFEEFPKLLEENLNLKIEEEIGFDDAIAFDVVDTFNGNTYCAEYSDSFLSIETDMGSIYITIEELKEK